MSVRTQRFNHGISLEERSEGLLVRQYDQAYLARNWRLSEAVQELVATCLDAGLKWMIRNGHPQVHARWPNAKGRAYLAFSPLKERQWSIAIDALNGEGSDFRFAVFNGKYNAQFEADKIPYSFEKRNRTSGHMEVQRSNFYGVLARLRNMDHEVLYQRSGLDLAFNSLKRQA